MNAYLISGLGADKRIFSKINLNPSVNIIHLDWIPFSKNQTLKDYAINLSKEINTTVPFVIIGVSFGGMIATEIAKHLNPVKTIIISSTIYNSQFQWIYKLSGKLNLLKLIPSWLLKSSNKFTQNYYFGTKSLEDKGLLSKIVEDTDPLFLKWAIGAILKWDNNVRPLNLLHIHGDNDKIFPIKKWNPISSLIAEPTLWFIKRL